MKFFKRGFFYIWSIFLPSTLMAAASSPHSSDGSQGNDLVNFVSQFDDDNVDTTSAMAVDTNVSTNISGDSLTNISDVSPTTAGYIRNAPRISSNQSLLGVGVGDEDEQKETELHDVTPGNIDSANFDITFGGDVDASLVRFSGTYKDIFSAFDPVNDDQSYFLVKLYDRDYGENFFVSQKGFGQEFQKIDSFMFAFKEMLFRNGDDAFFLKYKNILGMMLSRNFDNFLFSRSNAISPDIQHDINFERVLKGRIRENRSSLVQLEADLRYNVDRLDYHHVRHEDVESSSMSIWFRSLFFRRSFDAGMDSLISHNLFSSEKERAIVNFRNNCEEFKQFRDLYANKLGIYCHMNRYNEEVFDQLDDMLVLGEFPRNMRFFNWTHYDFDSYVGNMNVQYLHLDRNGGISGEELLKSIVKGRFDYTPGRWFPVKKWLYGGFACPFFGSFENERLLEKTIFFEKFTFKVFYFIRVVAKTPVIANYYSNINESFIINIYHVEIGFDFELHQQAREFHYRAFVSEKITESKIKVSQLKENRALKSDELEKDSKVLSRFEPSNNWGMTWFQNEDHFVNDVCLFHSFNNESKRNQSLIVTSFLKESQYAIEDLSIDIDSEEIVGIKCTSNFFVLCLEPLRENVFFKFLIFDKTRRCFKVTSNVKYYYRDDFNFVLSEKALWRNGQVAYELNIAIFEQRRKFFGFINLNVDRKVSLFKKQLLTVKKIVFEFIAHDWLIIFNQLNHCFYLVDFNDTDWFFDDWGNLSVPNFFYDASEDGVDVGKCFFVRNLNETYFVNMTSGESTIILKISNFVKVVEEMENLPIVQEFNSILAKKRGICPSDVLKDVDIEVDEGGFSLVRREKVTILTMLRNFNPHSESAQEAAARLSRLTQLRLAGGRFADISRLSVHLIRQRDESMLNRAHVTVNWFYEGFHFVSSIFRISMSTQDKELLIQLAERFRTEEQNRVFRAIEMGYVEEYRLNYFKVGVFLGLLGLGTFLIYKKRQMQRQFEIEDQIVIDAAKKSIFKKIANPFENKVVKPIVKAGVGVKNVTGSSRFGRKVKIAIVLVILFVLVNLFRKKRR